MDLVKGLVAVDEHYCVGTVLGIQRFDDTNDYILVHLRTGQVKAYGGFDDLTLFKGVDDALAFVRANIDEAAE